MDAHSTLWQLFHRNQRSFFFSSIHSMPGISRSRAVLLEDSKEPPDFLDRNLYDLYFFGRVPGRFADVFNVIREEMASLRRVNTGDMGVVTIGIISPAI